MEIAITKMSQNGQVVIPAEIRRDSKIKPKTKFLIFNENGNILLKPIREEMLREEFELISRIEKSEEEILEGKAIKVNSEVGIDKIDDLLMGD